MVGLTKGSIRKFMTGKGSEESMLQILKVKVEDVDDRSIAIMLRLSDGLNWCSKFVCFVDKDDHHFTYRFMVSSVLQVHSFSECTFLNMEFIKLDSVDIFRPESLYGLTIGKPKRLELKNAKIDYKGLVPVQDLHPNLSKSITIKVRLMYVSEKLQYTSISKERYFYVYYLADSTGEIRLFHYNSALIKDVKGKPLKVCKTYIIKNFIVQPVFNEKNTVWHNNEIRTIPETDFQRVDDDKTFPEYIFHLTSFSEIKDNLGHGSVIDVIGFCHGVMESEILPKRCGGEIAKRVAVLVDETGLSIQVDLWGDYARPDEFPYNQMALAIRGAVVQEKDGKRLTVSKCGFIHVNPSIPRTEELTEWYSSNGKDAKYKSISCKNIITEDAEDNMCMEIEEHGCSDDDMECYFAEDIYNEFNSDWDGS